MSCDPLVRTICGVEQDCAVLFHARVQLSIPLIWLEVVASFLGLETVERVQMAWIDTYFPI